MRIVNHVGLEAYLFGVVPGEMPFYWLPEALKVQAVAARSYALAVRKTGSDFDLYPDVRSQVYSGISGERAATTAAVQATAGQVVLYRGRIATTYFFSTSGAGRQRSTMSGPAAARFPIWFPLTTRTTRFLRITPGARSRCRAGGSRERSRCAVACSTSGSRSAPQDGFVP